MMRGVLMVVALWCVPNGPCYAAEGSLGGGDRAWLERLATVRPSPRQLAWQQRDVGVFIHFGMNTFTGGEWGNGQEDPRLFKPSALDCRQWCQVTRDLGAKSIILVAKHHDGFCLWPTRFTEHSVKASAWRNGRGDVVKELADACREFGLKLGIYLSAADLHHPAYGIDHDYSGPPVGGRTRVNSTIWVRPHCPSTARVSCVLCVLSRLIRSPPGPQARKVSTTARRDRLRAPVGVGIKIRIEIDDRGPDCDGNEVTPLPSLHASSAKSGLLPKEIEVLGLSKLHERDVVTANVSAWSSCPTNTPNWRPGPGPSTSTTSSPIRAAPRWTSGLLPSPATSPASTESGRQRASRTSS
jgi:hypothetical protein